MKYTRSDGGTETDENAALGEQGTERGWRFEELLKAEADPRAREGLSRVVLEAVPGGVVHVAKDGSIRAANAEALRFLGYSYDEIAGRYTSEWEPETCWEDGTPCTLEDYPVTRALVTGEPQPPATIGVRRPGGELAWAVFTAVPVKDVSSDETTGAIVTFLEITERKRAEAALAESEATLRSLVESAPSIILTTSTDGTIEFINRMVTGRRREDVLGSNLLDFVDEEHKELVRGHMEKAVRTGAPTSYEIAGPKDLKDRVFSARIGPITRDGRIVGLVVLADDVTEVRRLQSGIILADRMASVGTLAASVAHEVNNPLTYVMIELSRALASVREIETPEERRLLRDRIQRAQEGVERISRVVQDLRSHASTRDDDEAVLDASQVLESAIQVAWNEVRHRAELVRAYRPAPQVRASATRLGQVFLNLLVNAAQAIEEGGQSQGRIRVAVGEGEDGRVVIEIADNGPGIPAELASRVFEPFVTTKESGRGMGLGLYVCRNVIASLGGELELASDEGGGATFRIRLPAAKGERRSALLTAPPVPRRPVLRGLRVLVVDDEPGIRAALVDALGAHDLRLLSSGRAAIAALAEQRFDAVFCDLSMPAVSGIDVYNFLRRERPEQLESVIFMTGGGFTPRTRTFLEQAGRRILEKPFELEEVERALAEVAPGI